MADLRVGTEPGRIAGPDRPALLDYVVAVGDARERFDVLAIHAEHRVGALAIGDCAVWVGVSAAHRGAAFDACRYVIDEIKARVPIWKKEHYADGDSGWVNCATRAPAHRSGRAAEVS